MGLHGSLIVSLIRNLELSATCLLLLSSAQAAWGVVSPRKTVSKPIAAPLKPSQTPSTGSTPDWRRTPHGLSPNVRLRLVTPPAIFTHYHRQPHNGNAHSRRLRHPIPEGSHHHIHSTSCHPPLATLPSTLPCHSHRPRHRCQPIAGGVHLLRQLVCLSRH